MMMKYPRGHDAVTEETQLARLETAVVRAQMEPYSQGDEVPLGAASSLSRTDDLCANPYSCGSAMPSILIIDDDDAVRGLLRAVLEAEGYEVAEAANGRQGLNQYRLRPADVVITDILMSEMNGLVMLLKLTREFLHATVIAISGAGGKESALDVATLLGARQTFQKPMNMAELLNAVRYELVH